MNNFPLIRLVLCCLLLAAVPAGAQSADRQSKLAGLIRAGQAALDAGQFESAATNFQHARELSPESLDANRGLALCYLQLGKLREAAKLGDAALVHWPNDPQLLHWVGLAYFKGGQNARAQQLLERSEKADARHFDIHFDLALVLLAQEQQDAAGKELEQAIRLDPSQAMPHVLLGRVDQNSNRTVQAIEQFKTALRLDPKVPLGHYHLGFAYASLGRSAEAVEEYQKEMRQSPDNPQVLTHLGHCLLETGDLAAAVANLKKAVEIAPDNSTAAYDLGKGLLLLGDAQSATTALKRAVALKPDDSAAHYQLARALERTGDHAGAQKEWQAFAELKKSQPESGGMATGRVQ